MPEVFQDPMFFLRQFLFELWFVGRPCHEHGGQALGTGGIFLHRSSSCCYVRDKKYKIAKGHGLKVRKKKLKEKKEEYSRIALIGMYGL